MGLIFTIKLSLLGRDGVMAAAGDLKSPEEIRVGSNPTPGISQMM
jgi:hypothetical protein